VAAGAVVAGADVAAGVLAAVAEGVTVVCVTDGVAAVVAVAAVGLWLAKLLTALLTVLVTLEHPAIRHPATRRASRRARGFTERCMGVMVGWLRPVRLTQAG
jgi:hypothetical protein